MPSYFYTMTTSALYEIYLQHPSVQTDTRKLKRGDLFFALKGPNFNANAFAQNALDAGAAYVVVDDPEYANKENIILVDDVLNTLQELALHHRRQFKIPFIAVTGSNGKTTTRELIHAVLSATFTTYTTRGNLNNHIGIPLTLLSIRPGAEMAVIEMGANHQGEIASYCRYTEPTHGLITNCGKAHLEGFGSEEGVRKGKGELYDFLRATGGTAFVLKELDYLVLMSKGIREIVFYGGEDSAVTGTITRNAPFLEAAVEAYGEAVVVKSNLVGAYNLPNILAAMSVAHHFGVSSSSAADAIANYYPSNNRSQLIDAPAGNKIILDAYNANPSSMRIAIENLASLHAEKKVLILGAMAELGPKSAEEHQRIIELIQQYTWAGVFLVGGDFLNVAHPYEQFETAEAAGKRVSALGFTNAYMLIKGSRSRAMENVLDAIR